MSETNKADAAGGTSTPAPVTAPAGGKDTLPSAVEFEPPLACVRRILKNSLPSSTNVGKDASSAFARASGIFIIYLTACANDFARENRRQTITANDVLAAIKELEFEEFTPELKEFLERYRDTEKSKKEARLKAAAARKEAEEGENTVPSTPNSKVDEAEADVSMEVEADVEDESHVDEEVNAEDDEGASHQGEGEVHAEVDPDDDESRDMEQ